MLNMKLINRDAEGELQMIGRLDTNTAPDAEKILTETIERFDSLILDMAGVEYVSSAALRAILNANDLLSDKEGLTIRNVNKKVMEILRITGFSNYLDIR